MNERISIVLCTYNGQAYLPEQLASLARQQRPPDELIVADDQSTDATPEIVRAFATTAPFPVRFLQNAENLGLNRNFADAFARAEGDLVFFCDQDDVWHPQKLARFATAFALDPQVGLVFCDARVVSPQLAPLGHTHWQSVDFTPALQARFRHDPQDQRPYTAGAFEVLSRHCFVAGATAAVRRATRDAILPWPQEWAFDAWAAMVSASLWRTRIIPEPLNDYRQHPRQALGGARKGLWQRYLEARRAVNARHYTRIADMAERLAQRLLDQGLAQTDPRIDRLRAKMRFSNTRASMRRSFLARYPLLIKELTLGRYHQFGQGWRSAAVDALV